MANKKTKSTTMESALQKAVEEQENTETSSRMFHIVMMSPAPPTIRAPAADINIVSILFTAVSMLSKRLNAVFHRSAQTASCFASSKATSSASITISFISYFIKKYQFVKLYQKVNSMSSTIFVWYRF